jgi:hypothetical protein
MDELVGDVKVLIIDNPPEADYAIQDIIGGGFWRVWQL